MVKHAQEIAEKWGTDPQGEFKIVFESVLADRIEEVAKHLGIQEQSVLASYADQFEVAIMARNVCEAIQDRDQKAADEPSMEITIAEAGRLLASLGRVSWIVSFNEETLKVKEARLRAVNIQSAAADAISSIGLSLTEAASNGPVKTVTITGDALIKARSSLADTIEKIKRGAWDCGSPRLNEAVPIGMERDAFPILKRE